MQIGGSEARHLIDAINLLFLLVQCEKISYLLSSGTTTSTPRLIHVYL